MQTVTLNNAVETPRTELDYAASCLGATIAEGIAVRGEEVKDADTEVEAWLRRIGLPAR
ncbi:hypothetical protein [Streptomyces massasporeus]|uniref:hypothetical protein n=1 Tax=Streptomyces massasporeus TaxID=67324 RepID=UPI00340458AC